MDTKNEFGRSRPTADRTAKVPEFQLRIGAHHRHFRMLTMYRGLNVAMSIVVMTATRFPVRTRTRVHGDTAMLVVLGIFSAYLSRYSRR